MKYIYFVEENDTIESIAEKYKLKVKDILEFNKMTESDIQAGAVLVINKIEGVRYVVRPFDTLDKIAQKHGVSKETICKHNKLKDVFLGQVIYIPTN